MKRIFYDMHSKLFLLFEVTTNLTKSFPFFYFKIPKIKSLIHQNVFFLLLLPLKCPSIAGFKCIKIIVLSIEKIFLGSVENKMLLFAPRKSETRNKNQESRQRFMPWLLYPGS